MRGVKGSRKGEKKNWKSMKRDTIRKNVVEETEKGVQLDSVLCASEF